MYFDLFHFRIEINPEQYLDNLNISVSDRISRSPLTVPLVERTAISPLNGAPLRSPGINMPLENKTVQVDINEEIAILNYQDELRRSKQEALRQKKKKHGKKSKRKFITSSSEEDEDEESDPESSFDGGKIIKRRKNKNKFEQQSSEEYLNKTEITVNLNNKKCVKIRDCNALSKANQCNQLCCQQKSEVIVEEIKKKSEKCVCNETQVKHIVHKDDDDEDDRRQGGTDSGKSTRRVKIEEQRGSNENERPKENKQKGEGKSNGHRKQKDSTSNVETTAAENNETTNQATSEKEKHVKIGKRIEDKPDEVSYKEQAKYNKDMAKKIHEELVEREIVKVDIHEEAERKEEYEAEQKQTAVAKQKDDTNTTSDEIKTNDEINSTDEMKTTDEIQTIDEIKKTNEENVNGTKESNIELVTSDQIIDYPRIEIQEPSIASETESNAGTVPLDEKEDSITKSILVENANIVSGIAESITKQVESNQNKAQFTEEIKSDEPMKTGDKNEPKESNKKGPTPSDKTEKDNKGRKKLETTKSVESDEKTKEKPTKGNEKDNKKDTRKRDQKESRPRDKRNGSKTKDTDGNDDVVDIAKFVEMEQEAENQQKNQRNKDGQNDKSTKGQNDKSSKGKKAPKENDSEKENDKGLLAVLEDTNGDEIEQYDGRQGRRQRPKSAVGRRGQSNYPKVDSRRSKSSFQILTDDNIEDKDRNTQQTDDSGYRSRRDKHGNGEFIYHHIST